MKKSTRVLYASLYVLLCFTGSGWFQQAIAQTTLPFPVAHYPLYIDTFRQYKVVQPWDVSGNGRHGNTFDATTKTFYDAKFKRDSFPFPGGIPCIWKPEADAAWVNIPDPFPQYQNGNPFTLCFWVFWQYDMTSTTETVIKLHGLQVRLEGEKMILGINNAQTLIRLSTLDPSFSGEGWYFMALTDGGRTLYTRKYGASSHLQEMETIAPGSPYSINTARLMDTDFRGKLSQVRFYNTALPVEQLDIIYNEDIDWALHNINNNTYVKRNMYAYYPLDGAVFNDYKKDAVTRFGNRDAIVASGVVPAKDRFGRNDSALSFPLLNAYMELPPFFGDYLNDYEQYNNNIQKGFTISYWVFISPAQSSPSGGIELPFSDASPRQKIFYGTGIGDDSLFGMQKILDRVGFFRYNDIVPDQRYSWYLWLYDPISFRDLEGWCQVVWVQYADWLRIYLFKPGGISACQSIYLGIQDLTHPNIIEWGLGNHGGPSTGQTLALDDFRIYNWPLRPEEVNALHITEASNTNTLLSRACAACDLPETIVAKDSTGSKSDKAIEIFPNPANNYLTIRLPLKESKPIQVTILNTEGKPVFKRQYTLQKGMQQIILDHLNLLPGSYFIHLESSNLNETRTLIIQK